jgi:hypothetical protein
MAKATTRMKVIGKNMTHIEGGSVASTPAELLASEVLRSDDRRYQAMVSGDLVALDRLLAPALTYTHSSAHCENKKEYLASLSSGRVRYKTAQRDEVSVRILGETAILEGHVVLSATVDGVSRRLENRFLSVWSSQDDAWQLLAWASTPIPDASREEGNGAY